MSDLTRKGQPKLVEWKTTQENAYQTLKKYITNKPILHLPDLQKQFYLRTDGSKSGLGAVIMQEFDGVMFPISYASRKLTVAEKNYAAIELECLAITWGIQRFRNYLHGTKFVLETDHNSLQYLESKKYANARVMRWAMLLQPYKFKVNAIKGKVNHAADYLIKPHRLNSFKNTSVFFFNRGNCYDKPRITTTTTFKQASSSRYP